jgi:hypothetical protein
MFGARAGAGGFGVAAVSGPIATRVYPPARLVNVAFGDQLLVCLDDDAARDPEVFGKDARRGNEVPRDRHPARMPSRIDASIWRWSATSESRSSLTSTSPAGRRSVLLGGTGSDPIQGTDSCNASEVRRIINSTYHSRRRHRGPTPHHTEGP